ncbi:MAG: hypothetical protein V4616_13005 [Bacteroidota bacterium]
MLRSLVLSGLLVSAAAVSAQSGAVDMEQSGLRCYTMKAGAAIDTSVFPMHFGKMYSDAEGSAVLKMMVIPNHPGVTDRGTYTTVKNQKIIEENQYHSRENQVLYTRAVLSNADGSMEFTENYVVSVNEECAVIVSCHYPPELQKMVSGAVRQAAETAFIK